MTHRITRSSKKQKKLVTSVTELKLQITQIMSV